MPEVPENQQEDHGKKLQEWFAVGVLHFTRCPMIAWFPGTRFSHHQLQSVIPPLLETGLLKLTPSPARAMSM